MATTSGFYANEVVGALRPPAQIIQWNIHGPDPSGYRHVESGIYKPYAKTGWCGGFTAQHASGSALDFGEIYSSDTEGFYTDTICLTFNLGEVNSHADSHFVSASGIGTDYKAFNLRIWFYNNSSISGFSPTFYYLNSESWRRHLAMTSGTAGVSSVPTSQPSNRNITTRSANDVFVSGAYLRNEFSDYVYLVGHFPTGAHKLGTFGGLGQGDFTFKVSYDWTALTTNLLATDI